MWKKVLEGFLIKIIVCSSIKFMNFYPKKDYLDAKLKKEMTRTLRKTGFKTIKKQL